MSTDKKNARTRSPRHADQPDGTKAIYLGKELEGSLSAYACAAAAAGVSLLAMTKSAEAKIVYTPADVKIRINGGLVPLDLNHDGVADFTFSNFFHSIYTFSTPSFANLYVGPDAANPRNMVWGRGFMTSHGRTRFASALRRGFKVGANKSYFRKSPKALMARLDVSYVPNLARGGTTYYYRHVSRTSGQWLYTRQRYLGLKFTIGGQVHYGWARVAVGRTGTGYGKNSIAAMLIDYAYETIPNKPIITGKTEGGDDSVGGPATLGRLALGRK